MRTDLWKAIVRGFSFRLSPGAKRVLYPLFLSLALLSLWFLAAAYTTGGFDLGVVNLRNRGILWILLLLFGLPLLTVFRDKTARLWRQCMERDRIAPLLLFLLFTLVLLWSWDIPLRIEGDGVGYYSYLRSAVIDGDLKFANESKTLESWRYGLPLPTDNTQTGFVPNPYSIGPALLWSPFFLLVLISGPLLAPLGLSFPLDGYSLPFLYGVSLGARIYGLLALWMLYRSLRRLFSPFVSLTALLAVWLATPLTYYFVAETFMSHLLSFFAVSLLIYTVSLHGGRKSPLGWSLIGASLGLTGLVRWQDLTFGILPLAVLLALWFGKRLTPKERLLTGAAFGGGALVVLLPQLFIFRILYGFWLGIPQGTEFVSLVPRHLWEVLFSPLHGLFSWHPLTLLAVIGLLAATTRRVWRVTALWFLTAFALQVLFNSTLPQWWGGHAFGMRRLINSAPLWTFGFAFLLTLGSRRKVWIPSLTLLALLLSLVNFSLIKAYRLQAFHHEKPLPIGQILGYALGELKGESPKPLFDTSTELEERKRGVDQFFRSMPPHSLLLNLSTEERDSYVDLCTFSLFSEKAIFPVTLDEREWTKMEFFGRLVSLLGETPSLREVYLPGFSWEKEAPGAGVKLAYKMNHYPPLSKTLYNNIYTLSPRVAEILRKGGLTVQESSFGSVQTYKIRLYED